VPLQYESHRPPYSHVRDGVRTFNSGFRGLNCAPKSASSPYSSSPSCKADINGATFVRLTSRQPAVHCSALGRRVFACAIIGNFGPPPILPSTLTNGLPIASLKPTTASQVIMSSSQNLLLRGDTQDDARAASAWGPPALRSRICILATVTCWAFIAVLQYFLTKSLTQGGVIFSYDVSSLPLRQSFVYLYMPTIIAVIFSTFILWIDIDAKRFEPYYQLSKPNGALGKDSLLLRYPFDFMPLVPFFALRNR
jgi:hypothetical protein